MRGFPGEHAAGRFRGWRTAVRQAARHLHGCHRHGRRPHRRPPCHLHGCRPGGSRSASASRRGLLSCAGCTCGNSAGAESARRRAGTTRQLCGVSGSSSARQQASAQPLTSPSRTGAFTNVRRILRCVDDRQHDDVTSRDGVEDQIGESVNDGLSNVWIDFGVHQWLIDYSTKHFVDLVQEFLAEATLNLLVALVGIVHVVLSATCEPEDE